jgi:hypothetical protein
LTFRNRATYYDPLAAVPSDLIKSKAVSKKVLRVNNTLAKALILFKTQCHEFFKENEIKIGDKIH